VADIIEDENSLTFEQKKIFFRKWIAIISEHESPAGFGDELLPFILNHDSLPERLLIQNIEEVIRITRSFKEDVRKRLKRCITLMCMGMEWFQNHRSPHGLKSLIELEYYCYFVAGVVGELLTDLFCDYSTKISQRRETLRRLSISFGQGLQMTNILKDLWKDLDKGVCWLPRDIFQKKGFHLDELSNGGFSETFQKGLMELITIAQVHLKNALTYTLFLPKSEIGLRRFCLWAIGLAIFTLRKIKKRNNFISQGDVKISRRSVKLIIHVTQLTLRSNFLLKLLFHLTTKV
jgi:farnesyl-diphosphate farnesyltransferase